MSWHRKLDDSVTWQPHCDRGATAEFAFDVEPAVMALDDVLEKAPPPRAAREPAGLAQLCGHD
mgnify:CR=1 FL=1